MLGFHGALWPSPLPRGPVKWGFLLSLALHREGLILRSGLKKPVLSRRGFQVRFNTGQMHSGRGGVLWGADAGSPGEGLCVARPVLPGEAIPTPARCRRPEEAPVAPCGGCEQCRAGDRDPPALVQADSSRANAPTGAFSRLIAEMGGQVPARPGMREPRDLWIRQGLSERATRGH